MRKTILLPALLLSVVLAANAAEEKIRGVLEKTEKPGACAQITDALSDIYYLTKTDETEKLITDYVGKNIKVVITGVVETKEGEPVYYFNLKSIEKYVSKLPPAATPKDETKTEVKPAEVKPAEVKPEAVPANTPPASPEGKK